MNHPKPEEWLLYVENAADAETTARLTEHLGTCPHCANELAGWHRTITKLESLPWPEARGNQYRWVAPLIKWGIAALFMLTIGFAAGRVSAFGSNRLRASLADDVRSQLRQELRADLLAAISPDEKAPGDRFQKSLRADFQAALVQNANASTPERQRLVQEILHVVGTGRVEDQRETHAMFLTLKQKEEADHLALRWDLETLASKADDRLQQLAVINRGSTHP